MEPRPTATPATPARRRHDTFHDLLRPPADRRGPPRTGPTQPRWLPGSEHHHLRRRRPGPARRHSPRPIHPREFLRMLCATDISTAYLSPAVRRTTQMTPPGPAQHPLGRTGRARRAGMASIGRCERIGQLLQGPGLQRARVERRGAAVAKAQRHHRPSGPARVGGRGGVRRGHRGRSRRSGNPVRRSSGRCGVRPDGCGRCGVRPDGSGRCGVRPDGCGRRGDRAHGASRDVGDGRTELVSARRTPAPPPPGEAHQTRAASGASIESTTEYSSASSTAFTDSRSVASHGTTAVSSSRPRTVRT